jgi:hypothetical protein
MYYLALANCLDPKAKADSGLKVSNALVAQIRSVITGGQEPSAGGDIEGWAHNGVAQALLLARHEANVWDQLGPTEQAKVNDLMEAMGIGGNWGYNDANNFLTGVGQFGNFQKTNNPNYREGYVGVELAVIQYFGASSWDEMLGSFSYDTFVARLAVDGFTNITSSWANAGASLMESGGSDKFGGTGVGVKTPFVYQGHRSSDLIGIYGALSGYTWSAPVQSSVSGTNNGVSLTTHIDDNSQSPFQGQTGMEQEFNTTDSSGLRSDALYAYEGFMNSLITRTSLFVLNNWGCGNTQKTIVKHEAAGVGDLLYKIDRGYDGTSLRTKGQLALVGQDTPPSDGPISKGYLFDQSTWTSYISPVNTAC